MPVGTPSLAQKQRARRDRQERILSRKEDFVIPLLARRSYHLPGNGWGADWMQWFCNNHILFGICLHHPLHPLEWWERLLALVASISFGLVMTNAVYELYQMDPEGMAQEMVLILGYSVTKGMLLLWTLGGLCHSIFDMIIWKVMACACCHPGGSFGGCPCSSSFQNCGSYLLVPVIFMLLSLAAFLVLWRASHPSEIEDEAAQENDGDGDGDDDLYVDWQGFEGAGSFSFLAKYSVELVMAWFVHFPVMGSILFSGVLGCGRLPVLGGRPRDVRRVQEDSREYRRF